MSWLAAYLLTCVIEIPIVVGCLRALDWTPAGRVGWLRAVGFAWLLQLTHPVLWLVAPSSWPTMVLAELVVTLIEGAALAALVTIWGTAANLTGRMARLAVLVSLLANASSLLVGLLVQQL